MSYETEFRKVEGLCAANKGIAEEIEATIQAGGGNIVSGHTYTLEFSKEQNAFSVKSEQIKKSAAVIVQETPFVPAEYDFENIKDLFNDKLDYTSTQTFEQVKKLNADMLNIATKYEMFGGSAPSLVALKKFHSNFIGIQTYLGRIQEKLRNAQPVSLARLKDLNAAYKSVLDSVPGLTGANNVLHQAKQGQYNQTVSSANFIPGAAVRHCSYTSPHIYCNVGFLVEDLQNGTFNVRWAQNSYNFGGCTNAQHGSHLYYI